jgi:pimeloyl-ACP methyl ester carboxylesterase
VADVPETCYVKTADGVHIAYQVLGDGPVDLVVMPGGFNLEVEWEGPGVARFLGRLASFSRLIRLNLRGEGLSDSGGLGSWPALEQSLEQRAEDMLAVLDAVGSNRTALLGGNYGGQMMMFFAATYPGRTSALMLVGTPARFGWAPDYPWGMSVEEREARMRRAEEGWEGGVGLARMFGPSLGDDPGFISWMARLHRQSFSPGVAVAATRLVLETDLRHLLPSIQVPTLVLCRSGDQITGPDHARYLADHIGGAKLVELPGADMLMYLRDADAVVDEVEEFLTGTRHVPETDRVLATVLFTDIVGSTQQAAQLGDRRWRGLLDGHCRASATGPVPRPGGQSGGRRVLGDVRWAGAGDSVCLCHPGRVTCPRRRGSGRPPHRGDRGPRWGRGGVGREHRRPRGSPRQLRGGLGLLHGQRSRRRFGHSIRGPRRTRTQGRPRGVAPVRRRHLSVVVRQWS